MRLQGLLERCSSLLGTVAKSRLTAAMDRHLRKRKLAVVVPADKELIKAAGPRRGLALQATQLVSRLGQRSAGSGGRA